jgi:hypothetical protein
VDFRALVSDLGWNGKTFHLVAGTIWVLLAYPTIVWWKNSVLWVGLMSVYTCAGIHMGAFFSSASDKRLKEVKDGQADN